MLPEFEQIDKNISVNISMKEYNEIKKKMELLDSRCNDLLSELNYIYKHCARLQIQDEKPNKRKITIFITRSGVAQLIKKHIEERMNEMDQKIFSMFTTNIEVMIEE